MLLTVRNLHCRYNHQEVLRGISFELEEAGFLAIMGPNGAGKTTLLRVITLSVPNIEGEILYQGKDLRKLSRREIACRIAVLPQNLQIPFAFSVSEILQMARYPHKTRFSGISHKDKELMERVASKTDILPFLDRKVTQLSAGERQRVFLAQALIQEPSILFLDEPISHLDLGHQMEIFRLLKEVNEEGVAVIAIFHDLTFAFHFPRQILLLNNGKIHALGSPRDVLTQENIHAVFHADLTLVPQTGSDTPLLKYEFGKNR
jgi:iron complex transport system ATP-binding protein